MTELLLIPEDAPEREQIDVGLNALPSNAFIIGEPDVVLIESIRQYGGIYQPLVLALDPDATTVDEWGRGYKILAGRRRIKALRILANEWYSDNPDEDEDDNPWVRAPAILVTGIEDAGGALSVSLNATARPNVAGDLADIEYYEGKGYSEAQIAKAVGMKTSQVRERKTLSKLIPALRSKFNKGMMSANAAKEAAKLATDVQKEIAKDAGDGKVGSKAVREARMVKREAAQGDLATALGEMPTLADANTGGDGSDTEATRDAEDRGPELTIGGAYGSVLYEDDDLMIMANGRWEVTKMPVIDHDEGAEYFALQVRRVR